MKIPNCQLPAYVERTNDLPLFLGQVRGRIEDRLNQTGRCLVAIDGVPGAGKSTLINAINKNVDYQALQPIIHGMDNHLKTERHTPGRDQLHSSEAYFKENYCDDEAARRILDELLETEKDLVWPGSIYTRETGKHAPGEAINVKSKNERLIVFEGTGAIQVCKDIRDDVINLLVYADPETAIRAKIYRDDQAGRQARELFHRNDNELACQLRLKPTLDDYRLSKSIYALDNTEALEKTIAA